MIVELRIENFAIIQKLELEPQTGLVVVTGETGAGKSIILDAINVLVGGKVDSGMIRSGAERAIVEAVFVLPTSRQTEIRELLKREELDDAEGENSNLISLGREIKKGGRSSARVNGNSVSLSFLQQLGSYLVDIHGQSEHLSLLNVKSHLELLDRYCANENLIKDYRQKYEQLVSLRKHLQALHQQAADAARLTDLYNYQFNEITTAQIQEGETETIKQERDRLANAESLATQTQKALLCLDESTPESSSVTDLLGEVTQALATISQLDGSKKELYLQVTEIAEGVSDLGRSLNHYLEQIEFNPRRLEQLEARYEVLQNLLRKYGGSEQAVLDFGNSLQTKLEGIANSEEEIQKAEVIEKELLAALAAQAQALSQLRQQAALTMGQAVEKELADLSMQGARFVVEFKTKPDPAGLLSPTGETRAFNQNGWDWIEFLIAPNLGEGLAPLVKIASGGETSRLMLALKNVLAQADPVPTLIFDEIDQGIGGRVGVVVGEKLWQLGQQHQVFCVTHLPQLAAFSNQHYHVQKVVLGERTTTRIASLSAEERVEELALMLGVPNETNRQAARETLLMAQQRSQVLASQAGR